jgi:hypothetical protein
MQEILPYDLPYAIDITLYKHNYYDRLIMSYLKKHSQFTPVPNSNDSFIVNINDFKRVIVNKFSNEISSMKSLTEVEIGKNVNSLFFISKLLNNFQNLKYIKINISNKRKFTRLVEIDKTKAVISFDYKILTSIIDLTTYFSKKSEYRYINDILKRIGLIKHDTFGTRVSYIKTTSQELISLLSNFENTLMGDPNEPITAAMDKYIQSIDLIYDIIDKKIESDNCRIILVTDYVN